MGSTRTKHSLKLAVLVAALTVPSALYSTTESLAVGTDPGRATELRDDARVDVETGTPVDLFRVAYPVTPGTPEAMAEEYLRANAARLHLRSAELSDLTHRATWTSPAAHTVRFRQHVDGVPVLGPDIAVTINHRSIVTYVANGYRPEIELTSNEPRLEAAAAEAAALNHLGSPSQLSFLETDLVVHPGADSARLAWRTRAVPSRSPIGDWEILTDALSGEIFRVADRAAYVDGSGGVFNPDPLSSAGVNYNDPGFTDGGDANTPQLDGEVEIVVLRDLTMDGGNFQLIGPFAEIIDTESPFKGLFSQPSDTFDFDRQEDGFEAVNTYYHIETYMRYLNEDLGVPVEPFQYNGGARFDPHGLGGADNSHYIGATGIVAFGEGGVDDAEDADVVIHELGHAIHDWVTNGGLSQVNGLSEGTGDYVAASYSRFFGHWSPGDPQYNWVFDWDGHNPFWGGRRTDYFGHYPEDLTGQIHTDGQIWSTCNMRIWDAIGGQQIDRALVSGLGMTNGGTNQEAAAQAVLQAAVDLGYPGGEVSMMQTIYRDCGYDVMVNTGINTSIVGTCPGSVTITVTDATPNGLVAFGFGDGGGNTTIPSGVCAGTEVDLGNARPLTRIRADSDGSINIQRDAAPQTCGQDMQALDLDTCQTSNVFQVP